MMRAYLVHPLGSTQIEQRINSSASLDFAVVRADLQAETRNLCTAGPPPYFQRRLLRFSRSTPHYPAVVDSSEHQPTPLPPSAASPLAVSFRALCGDLRGVNGGLKATPPPLVPPRPTGSTRAKHL